MHWSETPIREKSSEAQNKYDLCWQGFGPTVLWHFCCCSDGKYYIMHGCFSLWTGNISVQGRQAAHDRSSGVTPKERAEICMTCFPFQTSCWPTQPPRSQMRKKHAIAKSYSFVIIVVFVLHPRSRICMTIHIFYSAVHYSFIPIRVWSISVNNDKIFSPYDALLGSLQCWHTGL